MRASDGDRDRVAAMLREHCSQGRLTIDEMHERLERTYGARTVGDLQRVTVDLPEEDMHELPVPARQAPSPVARGGVDAYRVALRVGWGLWATVSLLNFVVWLLVVVGEGAAIYPWWIWVAGPFGAVLLLATVFQPRR